MGTKVTPSKWERPDLAAYFSRPNTPAKDLPVGRLMRRTVASWQLSPEQARSRTHALLAKAAARRGYRPPVVLSPEQEAEQRARIAKLRQARTLKHAA